MQKLCDKIRLKRDDGPGREREGGGGGGEQRKR